MRCSRLLALPAKTISTHPISSRRPIKRQQQQRPSTEVRQAETMVG
jgi:hypothetical protein